MEEEISYLAQELERVKHILKEFKKIFNKEQRYD